MHEGHTGVLPPDWFWTIMAAKFGNTDVLKLKEERVTWRERLLLTEYYLNLARREHGAREEGDETPGFGGFKPPRDW